MASEGPNTRTRDGGAASPTPSGQIRPSDVIDDRPVGRFQYSVLALCGIVMFVDGFDTQAISYMAPTIAGEWGLPRSALGPIFSSALVGLMVGYLALSPLSDRFGHRRVVIVAVSAFGVLSLASIAADNITTLLVLRFLTGLGLGATAPSAISLTSEYAPKRLRATFVLVIYCGFSLGFVAAGLAAGTLIPTFGWRSLFLVGGAIPLVIVPLLIRYLPESPAFMARKDANTERLKSTLRRIDPGLALGSTLIIATADPEAPPQRSPLSSLFTRRWLLGTVLLWIVFAINLAAFYAMLSWLPTILTSLDYPINIVVTATTLTTVGGIAAALVTGPSMDRLGAYGTVGVLYFVGFIFVGLTGFALHAPLWVLLAATFLAGCCVSGGQKSVIALASVFYPAEIRATGLGWALGIGRIGGIAGPLLVGAAIGLQWSYTAVFLALAVPLLLASILVFLLGRRYGRTTRSGQLGIDEGQALERC